MHTILAIDQGTTSTRAMLFDRSGRPHARAQVELAQHFPRPGWVEHDPEDIWRDTVAVARAAIDRAEGGARVAAIGIANQRETTIVWDRDSGEPVHNAIVWQDRRGAELCERLRADGCEAMVSARTGLLLDPYFSASKIAWLLDAVPGLRRRGGGSPAASTRPTRPTPRARCSTTSTANAGTPSCSRCSACPRRCSPRSAPTTPSSAPPGCSARRCRLPAWPATSRRRASARRASRRG
jgi:hypothetical protein